VVSRRNAFRRHGARKKGAPALDVYTVKTDGPDPVRLTTNYGAGVGVR
jgi:hypothetical protein